MSAPSGPPPQYPYGPPPWGPGGQPWGPPPPPSPRGVNPWTVVGVVAAAALLTIIGVVGWNALRSRGSESQATASSSSTPTSAPVPTTRSATTSPSPGVPPQNRLEESLLSLPELVDILAPGASPDLDAKQNPSLDRPVNPQEVDPAQCTSALDAATALAYPPDSYTAFGYRAIIDGGALNGSVTQAAVQFSFPEKAAAFRDQQKSLWERCANTTVKQGKADHRIGPLLPFPDTLVLELPEQFSIEGLPLPGSCQRALKVVGDTVIDVGTCTFRTGSVLSARDVADALAAKLG